MTSYVELTVRGYPNSVTLANHGYGVHEVRVYHDPAAVLAAVSEHLWRTHRRIVAFQLYTGTLIVASADIPFVV